MIKLLCLLFITALEIFALEIPKGSSLDRRITSAPYDVNNVIRLNAKVGFVSVIEFAKEENIVNMATGFSEGWDLTAKGNLLFVTPKSLVTKVTEIETNEKGETREVEKDRTITPNQFEWKTNLVVSTNLSMYVFELNLNGDSNVFKISFIYPDREVAKLDRLVKQMKQKSEEAIVDAALNRVSVPRNWDFYMSVMSNSDSITPNYAYDDGVFTYLGFDNTKTFPSVFGYDDKQEHILNTHIKKDGNYDVLVIHKIMPQIVLRSGSKVVGIVNKGYAKNPVEKTQETSNDEMVERILQNAK